jgi:uncharacterized protein (UPF0335 family)
MIRDDKEFRAALRKIYDLEREKTEIAKQIKKIHTEIKTYKAIRKLGIQK